MIRSPSPPPIFPFHACVWQAKWEFSPLLRNYKIFLPKESHLLLSLDNSPSLFLPLFLSCPRTPVCVYVCYPPLLCFADSNRSWDGCAGYTDFVSEGLVGGIYRWTREWKESDFVVPGFWNELDIVRVWNQMKRSLSYSKPFWIKGEGEFLGVDTVAVYLLLLVSRRGDTLETNRRLKKKEKKDCFFD